VQIYSKGCYVNYGNQTVVKLKLELLNPICANS